MVGIWYTRSQTHLASTSAQSAPCFPGLSDTNTITQEKPRADGNPEWRVSFMFLLLKRWETMAIHFGNYFFPFSAFFLDFCFSASFLFSFSAFCYFVFPCFSAFIVLWFSASPLFCFSASSLLRFSASPLFCFSLLFCFSSFFASLLSAFPCFFAFLLLCFSLFFVSHTAENP